MAETPYELVAIPSPRGPVRVPADVAQRLGLSAAPTELNAGSIANLLAPLPAAPDPIQYAQAGEALMSVPDEGLVGQIEVPDFTQEPEIPATIDRTTEPLPQPQPRARRHTRPSRAPVIDNARGSIGRRTLNNLSASAEIPVVDNLTLSAEEAATQLPNILQAMGQPELAAQITDWLSRTDPAGAGMTHERLAVEQGLAGQSADQAIPVGEEGTMVPQPTALGPQGLSVGLRQFPDGTVNYVADLGNTDPATRQAVIQALQGSPEAQLLSDGTLRMGPTALGILQAQNLLAPGTAARGVSSTLLMGSPPEAQQGPGGTLVTQEGSLTQRAPIDQDIISAQGVLGDTLQALEEAALNGQLRMNDLTEQGFYALSDLREKQIAGLSQANEVAAQEYRTRLDNLAQTIDAVGQQRIDPEAFWGGGVSGGLRRIGAAVSIALGFMSGVDLGTNVNPGLEMIQQAIQNNIQAQEANIANQRGLLGDRRAALSMFRDQLGNEADAREAMMAAGWESAVHRLQGVLTGARDPVLRANGQALIVGARLRQLQHLATLQQNQYEITTETQTRSRVQGDPSAIIRSAMGVVPAAQQAAQPPRATGQRPAGQRRPRVQPPAAPTGGQAPVELIPIPDARGTEPAQARAFGELDERGRRTPGERPISRYIAAADGDINRVISEYNRLPAAQQNEIDAFAQNAAELMVAYDRIIELANERGIDAWDLTEGTGELRAFVGIAQANIRQLINLGVPTGIDTQLQAALLDDPSLLNWRNVITNRPAVIRGSQRALHLQAGVRLGNRGMVLNTPLARQQVMSRAEAAARRQQGR
jgi:hypothetical protein